MKRRCFIGHRGRYFMIRLGLGLSYAERNGAPVLVTEVRFGKVNGLWINTPWFACWMLFRRPSI